MFLKSVSKRPVIDDILDVSDFWCFTSRSIPLQVPWILRGTNTWYMIL